MDASEFSAGWLGLGRRLVRAGPEAERLKLLERGALLASSFSVVFHFFSIVFHIVFIFVQYFSLPVKYRRSMENMETMWKTKWENMGKQWKI